jgi:hypothetical protein
MLPPAHPKPYQIPFSSPNWRASLNCWYFLASYLDNDNGDHSEEDDEEEKHDTSVCCNLQRAVRAGLKFASHLDVAVKECSKMTYIFGTPLPPNLSSLWYKARPADMVRNGPAQTEMSILFYQPVQSISHNLLYGGLILRVVTNVLPDVCLNMNHSAGLDWGMDWPVG